MHSKPNSATADKKATKFQEIAILKPTERYPKGQPFAPIPRFFFRLWQEERVLPNSFWTTLLFVLDTTLGGSPEGTKGKIAQSQIPTDKKDVANWIAALASYGDGFLVRVDYAGWDNTNSSTFHINTQATQEDWENFIFYMRLAWREGHISRNDGNTPESVRAYFKSLPSKHKWQPEMWIRLLPIFEEPPEEEREKIFGDWVRRGFGIRAWAEHEDTALQNIGPEEICVLMHLLVIAWCNSKAESEKPLLPDDVEMLRSTFDRRFQGEHGDELFARVLAHFQKVNHPQFGKCLEYPWLTEQWQAAKADAAWELRADEMDKALGWGKYKSSGY
jgi:hypothetical protein